MVAFIAMCSFERVTLNILCIFIPDCNLLIVIHLPALTSYYTYIVGVDRSSNPFYNYFLSTNQNMEDKVII